MECPIKNLAYETNPYKGKSATRDCIKEECAWWFTERGGCCSIVAIASLLELARNGCF